MKKIEGENIVLSQNNFNSCETVQLKSISNTFLLYLGFHGSDLTFEFLKYLHQLSFSEV